MIRTLHNTLLKKEGKMYRALHNTLLKKKDTCTGAALRTVKKEEETQAVCKCRLSVRAHFLVAYFSSNTLHGCTVLLTLF